MTHPRAPTKNARKNGLSHAEGKWPRDVENTRPSPSLWHHASGSPHCGIAGAGDAHVELPGRDLEQDPGIFTQITEQVDLVAPGPGIR